MLEIGSRIQRNAYDDLVDKPLYKRKLALHLQSACVGHLHIGLCRSFARSFEAWQSEQVSCSYVHLAYRTTSLQQLLHGNCSSLTVQQRPTATQPLPLPRTFPTTLRGVLLYW